MWTEEGDMKRTIIATILLLSTVLAAQAHTTTYTFKGVSNPHGVLRRATPERAAAGGIDPVTQAGIDASNRATDDQTDAFRQAASQEPIEAVNAATFGQ
jgi:hypothetical protein